MQKQFFLLTKVIDMCEPRARAFVCFQNQRGSDWKTHLIFLLARTLSTYD